MQVYLHHLERKPQKRHFPYRMVFEAQDQLETQQNVHFYLLITSLKSKMGVPLLVIEILVTSTSASFA